MEKRNNAFALIELVMISAMLCGILIPAIGQTKRSAFNVLSIKT